MEIKAQKYPLCIRRDVYSKERLHLYTIYKLDKGEYA
jgi:hypothetical protein